MKNTLNPKLPKVTAPQNRKVQTSDHIYHSSTRIKLSQNSMSNISFIKNDKILTQHYGSPLLSNQQLQEVERQQKKRNNEFYSKMLSECPFNYTQQIDEVNTKSIIQYDQKKNLDVSNIQFKLLDLEDKTKVLQVLNETSAYADQLSQHNRRNKPNIIPQRQDVIKLARWIDYMLEQTNSDKKLKEEQTVEQIEKIFNLSLKELIREISIDCLEKGVLLEKIWNGYTKFTQSIFDQFQQEKKEQESEYLTQIQRIHKNYQQTLEVMSAKINILTNDFQKLKDKHQIKKNKCQQHVEQIQYQERDLINQNSELSELRQERSAYYSERDRLIAHIKIIEQENEKLQQQFQKYTIKMAGGKRFSIGSLTHIKYDENTRGTDTFDIQETMKLTNEQSTQKDFYNIEYNTQGTQTQPNNRSQLIQTEYDFSTQQEQQVTLSSEEELKSLREKRLLLEERIRQEQSISNDLKRSKNQIQKELEQKTAKFIQLDQIQNQQQKEIERLNAELNKLRNKLQQPSLIVIDNDMDKNLSLNPLRLNSRNSTSNRQSLSNIPEQEKISPTPPELNTQPINIKTNENDKQDKNQKLVPQKHENPKENVNQSLEKQEKQEKEKSNSQQKSQIKQQNPNSQRQQKQTKQQQQQKEVQKYYFQQQINNQTSNGGTNNQISSSHTQNAMGSQTTLVAPKQEIQNKKSNNGNKKNTKGETARQNDTRNVELSTVENFQEKEEKVISIPQVKGQKQKKVNNQTNNSSLVVEPVKELNKSQMHDAALEFISSLADRFWANPEQVEAQLPIQNVLKIIQSLYKERLEKKLPIYQLAYEFYINTFGLKQIAESKLTQFCQSVFNYRSTPRINLFGRFLYLLERLSDEDLEFYITTLVFLDDNNNPSNLMQCTPNQLYVQIQLSKAMEQIKQLQDQEQQIQLEQNLKKKVIFQGQKYLDLDEYFQLALEQFQLIRTAHKEQYNELFSAMDVNQNGQIELDEFSILLELIEPELDQRQYQQLFMKEAQNGMTFHHFGMFCMHNQLFLKQQQDKFLNYVDVIKQNEQLSQNWGELRRMVTKMLRDCCKFEEYYQDLVRRLDDALRKKETYCWLLWKILDEKAKNLYLEYYACKLIGPLDMINQKITSLY